MFKFMLIVMALVAAQILAEVDGGSAPGEKETTCPCGWTNKSKARILYGKEAAPNEFPWMVLLRTYFSKSRGQCGGAIVTVRHVITAAHCVVDKNRRQPFDPDKVHVLAGVHDIDKNTPKETLEEYRAERIFVRPEYLKNKTYDFAVIVINEIIKFSQFVGPVCLSPKSVAKTYQVLTIMGWGVTDIYKYSDVLMKAETMVVDSNECYAQTWEICTKTNPSATCNGDSGGPMVWLDPDTDRYTQVSLVSRGSLDCVSLPSVSTDVGYFYDYLQQIINDTYPYARTCIKV